MQAFEAHYEAARQMLAQAAIDSDAILAANPKNVPRAFHFVSVAHKALSDVLFDDTAPSLADPVQCMHHAEIALRAAEEAVQRMPKSPDHISMLITVKQSMADKLFEAGLPQEGMQTQKSIVDLAQSSEGALLAMDDDVFIYTYAQYAMRLAIKDPKAALPWAEKALAGIVKERNADPRDIRMAIWYATSLTSFGNIYRLAGDRQRGLEMMADGIRQTTSMLAKKPADPGDLFYPLAAAHRNLAEDALERGHVREALLQYQEAELVLSQDAAAIPDDLEVYAKRSENQLSMAETETRLGLKGQAIESHSLAIEYADRVLKLHPDNQVVQSLRNHAVESKL